MYQSVYQDLKLGFIGLGKYGFATAKAVLKSGHHNIENIYFEKPDNKLLKKLSSEKKLEIKNNYKNLENLLSRFKNNKATDNFSKEHILSINKLIDKICEGKNRIGVLIVSLDMDRGYEVLKIISNYFKKRKLENLWLFSSISKLEVSEIKLSTINNLRVIRYIPNLAIKRGQGIVSAYIEPEYNQEGEIIIKRVFKGCGEVLLLNQETFIDSARIITGSTIGLIAYFARILSDSIRELGIKDFKGKSDEIVYQSIGGILSLCNKKEGIYWNKLYEDILVAQNKSGEYGTTEFIINDLVSKNFPQIIKDCIKRCHNEYLRNKQNIEA